MLYRIFLLVGTTIFAGSTLFLPGPASAETPLNRAVVQSLRNQVRLLLQNQSPRPAKVRDAMVPGDALATARSSLAELRFNDSSLARIGEQALFRFLPNTRTFQLTNGTVLLLIPPGRGQTRVRTPNAAAGIRGSALFVRYIPETDITIVGALTNSGIEVSNRNQSESQVLEAGQLAVIVKDQIAQVYRFDLRTFYQTSDLVEGLGLARKDLPVKVDPAIQAVREETSAAVQTQEVLAKAGVIQNPDFIKRPSRPGSSASTMPNQFHNQPGAAPLTQPSTVPLDVLQPVNSVPVVLPEVVAPGASRALGVGTAAGAPGQSGNAPGRTGNTPGQSGNTPGQSGNIPGQSGNTPGQSGNTPGQSGNTPGQSGNIPGQSGGSTAVRSSSNAGPPGQTGTAPGLSGNTSGQSNAGPPGQTGTAPGLSGNTPGQSNAGPPGLTGTTPGQSGNNPGKGTAVRQSLELSSSPNLAES